jgi:hypothetical protein
MPAKTKFSAAHIAYVTSKFYIVKEILILNFLLFATQENYLKKLCLTRLVVIQIFLLRFCGFICTEYYRLI